MDELDKLKQQKLANMQAMQQQVQNQLEEQAEMQSQVEALEAFVKQHMAPDAIARYSNIKVAHQEKALKLLVVLGQLIKSGKTKNIDDSQLKQILLLITPQKRDFKIRKV